MVKSLYMVLLFVCYGPNTQTLGHFVRAGLHRNGVSQIQSLLYHQTLTSCMLGAFLRYTFKEKFNYFSSLSLLTVNVQKSGPPCITAIYYLIFHEDILMQPPSCIISQLPILEILKKLNIIKLSAIVFTFIMIFYVSIHLCLKFQGFFCTEVMDKNNFTKLEAV